MSDTDYGSDFGEAFQRHILAVAARFPSFVLRYRTALDHTYFASQVNKIIAKALFAHVDEFKTLPAQSTLYEAAKEHADEKFRVNVEKTIEKMYEEDISDVAAVQKRVVDFGKTQALVNAVLTTGEMIDAGKRKEILPHIQKALMVGEDILDLGIDFLGQLESRAASYLLPEEVQETIPTGITHLDHVINGGLGRGELGVVLAPPGRGKTTTLINIGYGALINVAKYTVVHYTLEISDTNVAKRYDDRLMGALVKTKKADPALYAEELKKRAKKAVQGRLIVKKYHTRQATVSMMKSHLTMLAGAGVHPDVVIVDYGDIVKPERRLGEMRHEQAGVYEDLRQMAGEFNCAVWTASQGKASTVNKALLTIEDFAESFEKAAIVDLAVAFCQTGDEKLKARARLFLAKYRNNQDNLSVWVNVNRDRCLIKSYGLFNSAGEQIPVFEEDPKLDGKGNILDGSEPSEEVVTTEHPPKVSSGPQPKGKVDTSKLKEEAGIKKPEKKKFDGPKPWEKAEPGMDPFPDRPKPPKGPVKKSGPLPSKKVTA